MRDFSVQMSVFVSKVPVHSGGRGKVTLYRVVADCLEDWEDLLAFLKGEAKGKSWVVAPKPDRERDWTDTSPLLPFAKVRPEVVAELVEEFEAPSLGSDYIKWAQHHLKMEMRRERGPVSYEAEWHHQTKLREVASRLRRFGFTEPTTWEFETRGQRQQVKTVNADIENLDLSQRKRLKPAQMDL